MRAGHSMVSGIGLLAQGASEPSQGEFQRVIADEQLGMPLEDALRSVAVRMDAKDMEQISLVAELQPPDRRQHGRGARPGRRSRYALAPS